MPRTAITVQDIDRDGIAPTYDAADAANGMSWSNTSQTEFAHITNDSGGNLTVTFTTSITVDGLAVTDKTVTISNGTSQFIGPFPNGWYGNSASTVYVDFSTATSVTIAVLRVTG